MKKTLFLALALAGVAMAEDTTQSCSSTFDFDFSDSILTGKTTLNTVSFVDGNFVATVTAVDDTKILSSGDWSSYGTGETAPDAESAAYDFIKGSGKATDLTLTISNLVAGGTYSFDFTTGVPFEGAGAWNEVSESNNYTSRTRTPEKTDAPQQIGVKHTTTYSYTDMVADENGQISITIKASSGAHSASFNVANITGVSSTNGVLGYVFAASTTQSGDVAMVVSNGSTDNSWAGAFGNAASVTTDNADLVLTGNVDMHFTKDFAGGAPDSSGSGGTTVFGIVNAGSVSGNVSLVFDAENASYGTFTGSNASSVVGAYNGSIGGTFSATINAGTFNHAIMGGIHTGSTDSIGATNITITGGTVKGNVYGGGVTGTITGNTSVTITSLTPFANHTETSVISAGGIGDTIEGNSSVTFSDIASGSYAGTVSGGDNVDGTSTLNITDSTLSLNNVEDFDSINIGTGSNLTVTGNIATGDKANLTFSFDEATAAKATANGFSSGIISGLFSGEGNLSVGESATFNEKKITSVDGHNLSVDGLVYCIVDKESGYAGTDANYIYVLGSDNSVKVSDVVHVGAYVGDQSTTYNPIPNSAANSALGYYVKAGAVLGISGDSTDSNLTAGQMLLNTKGDGDIILRGAGYKVDAPHEKTSVILSGATQATGNLYISPKMQTGVTSVTESQPVDLILEDGANISSFNSVTFSSQNGGLVINGEIGSDAQGRHINNLTLIGSGSNMMYVNTDSNEEIVLGGTTTLRTHEFYESTNNAGLSGATLMLDINQSAKVRIEKLVSIEEDPVTDYVHRTLYICSAYDDAYEHADVINGSVRIDSFDFRDNIAIQASARATGTLDVTINLAESNQWISSTQISTPWAQGAMQTPSLTLEGIGTYVLEETKDLKICIANLSTDVVDGQNLWRGTVQLTNVDATDSDNGTGNGIDFAYYGNSQSTVDFRGFKGEVVQWKDASATLAATQPESVTIESALKLTNTDTLSGYEVTGGIAKQTYTGAISGEGDFEVSATDSLDVTLAGDISQWEGNLKATAGSQKVTLSGEAKTVNAAITADGGELALTVDNNGETTSFNKAVKVTSLTVSEGSIAKLTQASTAGNISISGSAVELSDGLNIIGNSVSNGTIKNASITSTTENGTVELSALAASNLRLYGEDVTFHSTEEVTGFLAVAEEGYTEVSFSSDIFSGMTLADSEALASLTISNTVSNAELIDDLARTNVTIFLEGFTMESLKNSSGEWSWTNAKLDLDTSDAVTFSNGVTVANLLVANYASVTYVQNANGLTIRMYNIPEPTTATLSLLALAALAARRRRK